MWLVEQEAGADKGSDGGIGRVVLKVHELSWPGPVKREGCGS